MGLFNMDIVIDEEAFSTAASDLDQLSTRLQKLREDTMNMIDDLKTGWNTPAGRKFIQACELYLYQPLYDQKIVLDHISQTLADARTEYSSVFEEYEELQKALGKTQ